MSALEDRLRKHLGKRIVLQLMYGEQPFGLIGEVREEGGEIILFEDRRMIEGPPVATPQGMMRQQEVVPQSISYLGNIPEDKVIVIKVLLETGEEAKKQLEANAPLIKPAPVGSGFLPRG